MVERHTGGFKHNSNVLFLKLGTRYVDAHSIVNLCEDYFVTTQYFIEPVFPYFILFYVFVNIFY